MLDHTVMLTVCVTNIECLVIICSTLQIQYNLDVVLCQLFVIASNSQQLNCRKSASRPGYVVKLCPWIIMKKYLIGTDITDLLLRSMCR